MSELFGRRIQLKKDFKLTEICFLIAISATFGSLFFSEIMKLPPCSLCWYQRICMYPLAVIYGSAIWFNDKEYRKYAYPLLLIGLCLSIYHNLLYYEVIPDSIAPCSQGVSCTSKQIEFLGFLTIPLMSLASFSLISILEFFNFKFRRYL